MYSLWLACVGGLPLTISSISNGLLALRMPRRQRAPRRGCDRAESYDLTNTVSTIMWYFVVLAGIYPILTLLSSDSWGIALVFFLNTSLLRFFFYLSLDVVFAAFLNLLDTAVDVGLLLYSVRLTSNKNAHKSTSLHEQLSSSRPYYDTGYTMYHTD